ncbi:MAG TPA: rhodanese-like domain-containing protein [Gammaproteobacteria bacterium]
MITLPEASLFLMLVLAGAPALAVAEDAAAAGAVASGEPALAVSSAGGEPAVAVSAASGADAALRGAPGADAAVDAAAIPPIDTHVLLDYLAGRAPFMLLDARSPEEYAVGHVHNAVNVPHDAVEDYLDVLPEDRAAPLVTYCKTGKRALELAARLRELGYENVRVLGPKQMFWSDTAPMFNCGAPETTDSFLPASR